MDIIQAVENKIENLPPLPETVLRIQEVCNNPKSSARDLVAVVEKDPILTAKLLKIANSPYYGFTSKITSINHAIALFGMSTILGLALSSVVRKNFNQINLSPYGITTEEFANSSFKQNRLMIHWHFSLDLKDSDTLVPASFVNEIGKIITAEILIEKNLKDEFLQEIFKEDADIPTVERDFLGISSIEITGKILYKWLLNVKIIYPILASENPEETDESLKPYAYAIKIVRTAIGQKGEVSNDTIHKALQLLEKAGFNKKDFLLSVKKFME